MLTNQRVAHVFRSRFRAAVACAAFLGLPAVASASNYIVVMGGSPQPLGKSADFTDAGGSFDVRWRHYNRGRTAFEFSVGYLNNSLSGEIPATIDGFEALIREKNVLAQQQSGPGEGIVIAEFGTLDIYSFNANIIYRVSRRSRVSPTVSVGAGVYNWRVPFRVRFENVPSFGEQRAFDPIADSRRYEFVFDDRFPEQVIDYTKHETTGGLNAALGADLRLTKALSLEFEGRTHLIFSSGKGNPEESADNQDYLSPMYFLLLHAGLSYRF